MTVEVGMKESSKKKGVRGLVMLNKMGDEKRRRGRPKLRRGIALKVSQKEWEKNGKN